MRNSGYFYLTIVFLVWGMTYLAMRIGVKPDSGFHVFAFGASRCLVAAILLFLITKLRHQSIRPNRKELFHLIVTGVGMWTISHGMVLFAEQYVDSGFAAIAVSASPIWALLLLGLIDKTKPNLQHILYIIIGFSGIVTLVFPTLQKSSVNYSIHIFLLLISPICWAYCAIHVKKYPIKLSVFATSAYQHLFGGMGFFALSLIFKEPLPTPTLSGWSAFGFLVIFGSIIAYTSYIKALQLLPTHLVMTNTYVNPIIAVILGWLILNEPITLRTLLAIILVILSVSGILHLNRVQPVLPTNR